MERSLVCILIALLPIAAAVSDPAGDVARQLNGPPVESPSVDILDVQGTLENGTLEMTMRLAGELLFDGTPNATREYAYLFIVAIGEDDDVDLYRHLTSQNASLVVRCAFRPGAGDAGCVVTQGEGRIRGLLMEGHNLTARVAVDWVGQFGIGGAATEAFDDQSPSVVAQDFTDNAIPYQQPGAGATQEKIERPWWQTPWLLVGAAVVGIGFGLWRRSKRAE